MTSRSRFTFPASSDATGLPSSTTGSLIFAVSNSGSDAYNGKRDGVTAGDFSSIPFATLSECIKFIPKVNHSVIVKIAAGNFAGANLVGLAGGWLDSADLKVKGVKFLGSTAVATLTTGDNSGTAGSGTSSTSLVKPTAAANWTASNLVGKFLRITGGGGAGPDVTNSPVMRPIKANTTTTATVDAIAGMDDTTTFQIVDCASIIYNSAEDVGFNLMLNECPIEIVGCEIYNPFAGLLDYGIRSVSNNIISVGGCRILGADINAIISDKDSEFSLTNCILDGGADAVITGCSKYFASENLLLEASGPVEVNSCLRARITKLDSAGAITNVFRALNCNFVEIEAKASGGSVTPFYFENVAYLDVIGSNKLTGSSNTGGSTYGIEIEKSGRCQLIGSDVTGAAGDVLFMGRSVTWTILNGPDYGVVEEHSGSAFAASNINTAIKYGNYLFFGEVKTSSRMQEFGYHNFAANTSQVVLTGTDNYDMSASARTVVDVACNSASATVTLPDAAAICGCFATIVNTGSQTVTVVAPSGGAVIGTATVAANTAGTFFSVNALGGKTFVRQV